MVQGLAITGGNAITAGSAAVAVAVGAVAVAAEGTEDTEVAPQPK